jgi:hypothetical protein
MARIRLLENHELDEDSRRVAEQMEAQGHDTSTLRGLAHSRELFRTYNQFYLPARNGYSLSDALIEMVRLRIARHNDCFT